jgi:hypothetical protein
VGNLPQFYVGHGGPTLLALTHIYSIGIQRVLAAILLGIVTYEANLLILDPPPRRREHKGR